MKTKFAKYNIPAALLMILFSAATTNAEEKTCSLEVSIDGIRNNSGSIMMGLFNQPHDDFPGEKKEFKNAYIKITDKKATQSFTLPCGKYAVSVFHDENGNRQLDANSIGIPKEGYGFSMNHPDSKFGPPEYKKAEFKLKKGKKKISIQMIYLF
ncbi:MAG: DUF2141 domain-containing protein [Spirochaetia bacterium]|nr:DUF2141 domain-containing protein [Spirochaetia bacterium]